MITELTQKIVSEAKPRGWVLEPDAKTVMREAGLTVPEFCFAKDIDMALNAAKKLGYPLAAKIVSPKVLHKTEVKGVAVGVGSDRSLKEVVSRFSRIEGYTGVHLEKMVGGVELILGAKIDEQFGPVILLGMGGTGVEIYQDVAIRMAPLDRKDVAAMIGSLKGRKLLDGYRGAGAVDHESLIRTVLDFSNLVMDLRDEIESIDLNPVFCSETGCVVADARIIL